LRYAGVPIDDDSLFFSWSSFLHSSGNFTLGADGLLDWIPAPAGFNHFFLGQVFLPLPLPGAFVAPVSLAVATNSAFGAAAFGTGLDRSIVVLLGEDSILTLLEGLIDML